MGTKYINVENLKEYAQWTLADVLMEIDDVLDHEDVVEVLEGHWNCSNTRSSDG